MWVPFHFISQAIRENGVEMVKWLYDRDYNFSVRASFEVLYAMDDAVSLKTLQLLSHGHRDVGYSTRAMDEAARFSDSQRVKFLHEHRAEGCATNAMNHAAAGGELEIVMHLHENRGEGCTVAAVNRAAGYGHLDVVRFLHENQSEGYTTERCTWQRRVIESKWSRFCTSTEAKGALPMR